MSSASTIDARRSRILSAVGWLEDRDAANQRHMEEANRRMGADDWGRADGPRPLAIPMRPVDRSRRPRARTGSRRLRGRVLLPDPMNRTGWWPALDDAAARSI